MRSNTKFLFYTATVSLLISSCTPTTGSNSSGNSYEPEVHSYESVLRFEVMDNLDGTFFRVITDDYERTLGYLKSSAKKPKLPGDYFSITYTGDIYGKPIYPPIFELEGELLSINVIEAEQMVFTYKIIDGEGVFVPEDSDFKFNYNYPEFYFSKGTEIESFDELQEGDKLFGRYSITEDIVDEKGVVTHSIRCFTKFKY